MILLLVILPISQQQIQSKSPTSPLGNGHEPAQILCITGLALGGSQATTCIGRLQLLHKGVHIFFVWNVSPYTRVCDHALYAVK